MLGGFFKRRLTTNVGVSRDYFRQNRNRNNVTNPATGEIQFVDLAGAPIAAPGPYSVPVVPFNRTYATNQTYGGVFRVLPWLGVGAGYFESSLFTDSASIDLAGRPRLPRNGEGHEFSLRFNFLEERVTAVVTRFDTVAENNAAALTAAVQLELNASLPAGSTLSGTGDYRDQTTRGYEFELQANVTRHWTLRATYSTNHVEFTRFFPLVRPYLALARDTARSRGQDPDTALLLTEQFLADQEGATGAVRRETANVATRYTFSSGPLKGFAVGTSARYALGKLQPALLVAGQVAIPAARTEDLILANPFLSYRRKLGGLNWLFQLNVNNVFDNRSNQGNDHTWPRFIDPRQYITTVTAEF